MFVVVVVVAVAAAAGGVVVAAAAIVVVVVVAVVGWVLTAVVPVVLSGPLLEPAESQSEESQLSPWWSPDQPPPLASPWQSSRG